VREPLRVAAVQPACAARDVAGNAEVHAAAIRAAEAQVVVFPELSLTGYELDASPVAPDDPDRGRLCDDGVACPGRCAGCR